MYWQVYLHKTTVAGERVLINTLLRAKYLAKNGKDLFCSPSLKYFIYNDVDRNWFDTHPEALTFYAQLDENDIWNALTIWRQDEDKVLSTLAKNIITRNIFRVEVLDKEFDEGYIANKRSEIADALGVTYEESIYFVSHIKAQKDMYNVNYEHISMLFNDGTLRDVTEVSELLSSDLMSKKLSKYYLCYQRI